MSFNCTRCACCCRTVHAIPFWPTRPDGACLALQDDNTCAIYETRPDLCRVDRLRPPDVSERDWHAATADACTALQERYGVGEAYRVVLEPTPSSRDTSS